MTNEPNLYLLTKAERAEYERFDVMKNLTVREGFRYQSWTYVALTTWMALTFFFFMLYIWVDEAEATGILTKNQEAASGAALVIVMLGGGVGVFVILFHNGTRALVRHREAFLERIGYADREKNMSEDDDYSPTRRQTQHAWYQGHSELNWQDRVRAESYGMDVDSYINNVAEHDKD